MNDALSVAAPRSTAARVIGVSFLAQMLVSGGTTYMFGYFLTPIADEFGATRSAVASGQSIFMLVAALLLPAVGRVIDARALRGLMLAGALLMGAAMAAVSQAAHLWQAGVLAGLIALGSSLCGSLAANALVVRGFAEGRERALGLASVGTSAGGFVLPLLVTPLIESEGWRSALLVLGLGSGLILAAGAWFGTPPEIDRPLPRSASHGGADYSWGSALRAPNFWAITLAMMIVYGANVALIANLPSYAGDLGIAPGRRAWLVSALAASSLVGKLLYSAFAERFDPRAPIWLAGAVQVPALSFLLLAPRFEVMLATAAASGLGTGSLLPAWSALVARCFGAPHFASVMGLSRLAAYPLIATGGVLAALSKDLTGSYDLGFQGFLSASFAVIALPFLMRLPGRV
jgi:MFS family permease